MKIANDLISCIKTNLSLVDFLCSQGYELKPRGKDYVLCCPFHEDKTPSCVITPSKNLYHCFGCNAAGSIIDWVMHTERLELSQAITWLQEYAGMKTKQDDYSSLAVSDVSKTPPGNWPTDLGDQDCLQQVMNFYHQTLKQSPDAQCYLEKRGLIHPEIIEYFKLGYANRSLFKLLPHTRRKDGAAIRAQLQRLGVLRQNGQEHLSGSLVIPILDMNHQVTQLYGRKTANKSDLRPGTPLHLYLAGKSCGIWNEAALQVSKEIILCEALIDALTFWVHGFRNVTTSFGVHGFTDVHLNAFKAYDIQRVLIAYDRDEAGNTAAEQLAARLAKENITCVRVLFPLNQDVNSYALSIKNKAEIPKALAQRLEQAMSCEASILVVKPKPIISSLAEAKGTVEAVKRENTDVVLPQLKITDHEITIHFGPRYYRIRGFDNNSHYEQLKINLLVRCQDQMHVDSFDLYLDKPRYHFIKRAALELQTTEQVIKKDIAQLWQQLEALQAKQLEQNKTSNNRHDITISDSARKQALAFLQSENLIEKIQEDYETLGLVGEETNKLVSYLSCVSRKTHKPLAVLIQSTSAAGKSSLMDTTLKFMPPEQTLQYSAMTGQSLFYMGETDLQHKILAIAEFEGAESASYALKLLQSEGEITIASTGKDEKTGELKSKDYRVQGPIMLFYTTTAIDVDEELKNRCLVLTVDESQQQTQRIHQLQRNKRTLAGLMLQRNKTDIIERHHNAQRLLKSLHVVNPYVNDLTFLSHQTRTRRDHEKYLNLIDSIALLHQYQREIKTHDKTGQQYIEVILNDIQLANQLCHEVLGHSLDELPPQTKNLLTLIHAMVQQRCLELHVSPSDIRFSRKDIRHYTQWSDGQLKIHCRRLEELEYLLVHRGSRGALIQYELLYDGNPHLYQNHQMGLIDLNKYQYDDKKLGLKIKKSAQKSEKSASSQGQVSPKLGGVRVAENEKYTAYTDLNGETLKNLPKSISSPKKTKAHHHRHQPSTSH